MAAKIALMTLAENSPPDYSYDNSYAATLGRSYFPGDVFPESDSYSENNSAEPENKLPDDYDYYEEMYSLSERSAIM